MAGNATIDHGSARVAVPAEMTGLHDTVWSALGEPGTWLTGAERVDVIREVRAARSCVLCEQRREALVAGAVEGEHDTVTSLPEDVIEVIHKLTTDASRISSAWAVDRVDGLGSGTYTEVVGTVAVTHVVDVLCIALGLVVPEVPAPTPGEPSRETPDGLDDTETAYVPQVADDRLPNVRRALTGVPQTLGHFWTLVSPMYSGTAFAELVWTHRALDRPQVELLAARTSAMNECFY